MRSRISPSIARVKWIWICLPMLVGGVVALLCWRGWLPNPIVHVRADVGIVAMSLGLLLTFMWALAWWQGRRQETVLQQVRQEAQEEHRRFLRRLDHELKNPLTAIRVALANLAEGQELSPQLLQSVERETLRIGRLATDLRKLADVEVGDLEEEQVDLPELLGEVVGAVGEQEEAEGRTIQLSLPSAPWPLSPVQGDPDLLFLAVHNLAMNALKFSSYGDSVEVRASAQENYVQLEVADTGCGIPKEEAPYIWDELYRGQGARGTPGSGVGLALVRAIVAQHHGQLEMRSRAGQGSLFIVRLPITQ